MEGRVRYAAMVDAPRVLGVVLGCVPAPDGEVQTTREGDGIVHHDDLLVQGCTGRVVAVQAELDVPMCLPAELDAWQGLALERIHNIAVPGKDIHLQVAALTHQGIKERTEFVGIPARRPVGPEPRATVDVPGHDEDRAPGVLDGLGKGGEVGRSVNEKGSARRMCAAPAVLSGHGNLLGDCAGHAVGGGLAHTLLFPLVYSRPDWLTIMLTVTRLTESVGPQIGS